MVSTNKYAAAHRSPNGPGDDRPTALQIVHDEGLEGKLADKVCLVTGTSSGIGIETAKALAATDALVFCTARDVKKAQEALSHAKGRFEFIECDLSSLASVRSAAEEFLNRSGGKLNLLINNAGVMAVPTRTLTVDGYEMQFGTNHLGHFLLFQLLKPALLASSTPDFHSRVVNLSSGGHRRSGIHFDNLSLEGEYSPWVAYGQSKTANIYMTNAIERKYGTRGVHGLAVHPGGIWTSLSRYLPESQLQVWRDDPAAKAGMKSIEQGAATTILAALGSEFDKKGRVYLEDAGEWGPVSEGMKQGHVPHAFDEQAEDRLWRESCVMVGIQDD